MVINNSRLLFPNPVSLLKQYSESISRVNDNTVRVVGPTKDVQLNMASQRDSVPYYKSYRRTLDLASVHTWPVLVRRRFLLEFKDKLIPYVARPSRSTRSALTGAIDIVIQKSILRNRT